MVKLDFFVVMVTGPRSYIDRKRVFQTLSKLDESKQIDCLVLTDDAGVCAFALEWAEKYKVNYAKFFAQDNKEMANHRRADEMLRRTHPQLLLMFPGGALSEWIEANVHRRFPQIEVKHVK